MEKQISSKGETKMFNLTGALPKFSDEDMERYTSKALALDLLLDIDGRTRFEVDDVFNIKESNSTLKSISAMELGTTIAFMMREFKGRYFFRPFKEVDGNIKVWDAVEDYLIDGNDIFNIHLYLDRII